MSTRAHIRVKNRYGHVKLYCHCDGYHHGLGMVLKRYLNSLSIWEADMIAYQLIKGDEIKDDFFPAHIIRPTTCLHGDEAYIYVIDVEKKTLVCYEHKMDETFEECCIPKRRRIIREYKRK